jgi:hypothetical protein
MKKLNFTFIKQLISEEWELTKGLLSNESENSSKRYIMIGSFYMLCIQSLLNQLFALAFDWHLSLIFACIATGTAIMTVIENLKSLKQ